VTIAFEPALGWGDRCQYNRPPLTKSTNTTKPMIQVDRPIPSGAGRGATRLTWVVRALVGDAFAGEGDAAGLFLRLLMDNPFYSRSHIHM